jgi:HAD superfamily phosphoserine phosphatase-like hydrolase
MTRCRCRPPCGRGHVAGTGHRSRLPRFRDPLPGGGVSARSLFRCAPPADSRPPPVVPDSMPVLLFDFDSTLVQDEGLDELFRFSLEGRRDAGERLSAFRAITDRGMEGLLSWEESLRARMELVVATRELVERTGRHLARRLTPSVERHAAAGFFRSAGCDIHIVSGGFTELITPAAERLGIPPERVHAHRFRFDHRGRVAGADPDTALARGGKGGGGPSPGAGPGTYLDRRRRSHGSRDPGSGVRRHLRGLHGEPPPGAGGGRPPITKPPPWKTSSPCWKEPDPRAPETPASDPPRVLLLEKIHSVPWSGSRRGATRWRRWGEPSRGRNSSNG